MSKYAPLGNVTLFAELLEKVINRPRDLPGIGVFYGWAGLGKTKSATYGANRYEASYLEVGESWGKGAFCKKLLTELAQPDKGTIADMVDRIIVTLMTTDRPLIIDEFDHVIRKGYIETVREIHDKSGVPIVLIGEEMLPHRIKQFERFDSRVLAQVAAQKCNSSDGYMLAKIYAPNVEIAPDMMDTVIAQTKGITRRIATNLYMISGTAKVEGWQTVDRATWGNRPLYTNAVPTRRKG
jgi:DNA transposition AAA+ family ATPase